MKRSILAVVFCTLLHPCCEGAEVWFFNGMENPDTGYLVYPAASTIVVVDAEKYRDKPVIELHLAGDTSSGAGLKRATEYNFSSNLRGATLKFACRAITAPCGLKVDLITGEIDHKQMVARIEKPFTAEMKWTEVSIPLADFLKEGVYQFYFDSEQMQAYPNLDAPFDMRRVRAVQFENDQPHPCDIYIADIRIETPD